MSFNLCEKTNLNSSTKIGEILYWTLHVANCSHRSKSYEQVHHGGQGLIRRKSSEADCSPLGMANVGYCSLLRNS